MVALATMTYRERKIVEEHNRRYSTYCRHDLGVATVEIYWKQAVAKYENELHHLQLRQIPGRYLVSN